MKVIHAVSGFPPDASGGTEIYVAKLVEKLAQRGVSSSVVAPREVNPLEETHQVSTYSYHNIKVVRYPVPAFPPLEQWQEIVPHDHFEVFETWLKQQSAAVFHQHSYRFDCGSHHLRLAKQLGMKTLMTLHIPEPMCLRKTMMRNGIEPCDGKIDEAQCSICLGISTKVPVAIARGLGLLPPMLSREMKKTLHQFPSFRIHQLGTTLGTPSLVSRNRQRVQEMAAMCDRIVCVCRWMKDVLIRNQLSSEKLVLCPQGSPIPYQPELKPPKQPNTPLKLGFLGRWHETKGIHILIEALQQLPADIPVELTLHGSLHGKFHSGSEIQARVKEIANQDARIQIKPVLPPEEVKRAIANFDLLAVPSQWFETGPLVVREAHAVGTPVMGSDLGGIAELVRHGIDGWLVNAQNVSAWRDAIAHFATHPELVEQLRQGIEPVRTFEEVADEMKAEYEHLLTQKAWI
jgi:glycosyltransferase involved in cell wall biosynthesis